MDKKKIGKCKPRIQRKSGEEIAKELMDYERIDDYRMLRLYDRIKYIRKDTGNLVGGGLLVLVEKDEENQIYLVIQGAIDYKTCKPIRFSVRFCDIIVFRRKDRDNE